MDGLTSTERSKEFRQTSMPHAVNSPYLAAFPSSKRKSFSPKDRYSDKLTPEFDPSTYSAGQSLASILNNPHVDSSWGTWFFAADPSLEASAPLPSKPLQEITKADFKTYIDSVDEPYSRFVDVREHSNFEEDLETANGIVEERKGNITGLAACLREIPSLYFEQDFALEKGSTFQAACPFSTIPQNNLLEEKLSHYLDVVEVHLVREISARSESFFEAQAHLEDLNSKMIQACEQITQLKSTVRLLEADLVDSADEIHTLNYRRENVLALHDKLKLIAYVNQAMTALRLLIAAADCASALDVIDELQHLIEGDELVGMHCFRHLSDQLASSRDAVNSMLAADFVRLAIHDAKDLQSGVILSSLSMQDKLHLISSETKVDEEEEVRLKEELVPLVIGLLRTSKLPATLKIYKDTLTTDIKAAIKTVVAEVLPLLLIRHSDADTPAADRQMELDVSALSLASKLRNLPPDEFVQLLVAVFKIIQTRLVRATKIQHFIEQIIGGLQGSYAAAAVAAAFASGAAAVAAAEAAEEQQQQESLPILAVTESDPLMSRSTGGVLFSSISKQFRADVLRENTEAVWAACDVAHGRWAKLLGVRAPVHMKLRLQEFVSIYNITQEFISTTEKVGGRLGYNIRGTLQSQSKSFVDSQHSNRMSKITAVLDQETWIAVDVPDEFQEIVDKLSAAGTSSDGDGIISPHDEEHLQNGCAEEKTPLTETTAKKGREKATAVKTLQIHGSGYHLVNSGLMLLKMISEYVDVSNVLPALATEIVHRVSEILKVFNSRACQLVLGAGALQVSGLKSITAKHLALASQATTFFWVLIPDIKRVLSVYIPESRKPFLLTELDRVAQDFKVHKDEIHTKLVQIMKERLMVHLRMLPQVLEGWNKADESDTQPSQFARSLTKEVGVLHRVLSPLLLEADLRSIFTRVVMTFHSQLTDTFSSLEVSTPQANARLYRDINHILVCIRALPSDPMDVNAGDLDAFVSKRFGNEMLIPSL